jgi:twitching motility protein PilT
MDKLKNLIKEGFGKKAKWIGIRPNEPLEWNLPDGTQFSSALAPLDSAWIDKMYSAFFSSQKLDLDQKVGVKAPLQISGIGTLILVGKITETHNIFGIFFPPNPDAEAQSFIDSLNAPPPDLALDFSLDFSLEAPAPSDSSQDFSFGSPPPGDSKNFSSNDMFSMSETHVLSEEPVLPPIIVSHTHAPTEDPFLPPFDPFGSTPESPPEPVFQSQPMPPQVAPPVTPIQISQSPGVFSGGKIDPILKTMIERKASDLHMTMGQPIIFRIDGDIVRQKDYSPLTEETIKDYLYPLIPEQKRLFFEETGDTDFAYSIPNFGRFRVNIFQDHQGMGAVIRHIPTDIQSADQLGLPETIRKFCRLSKGLVLVTGPTGSGKSTTLAAMIDLINMERADHVLTIEDPIEFVHPQKKCLINQREVGRHTKSFSTALKAALREDPDIVLVGELRDLETTEMALETAETGHLVFATLHTNTAVSTIDRVIDQFSPDEQRVIRNMLASSIKGVVSQTLCKKVGGGRCAAYEILVPNEAVSSMIRDSKIHLLSNHMQTASQDGNLLMNESLLILVQQGKVTYGEAWKKAVDKKDFQEGAKRKNIAIPK